MVSCLWGCGGADVPSNSETVADLSSQGTPRGGGDGGVFTGGDSKDAIVEGLRLATIEGMEKFLSDPVFLDRVCFTTTLGHQVSNLVRLLEFNARVTCRRFFERHHEALAALFRNQTLMKVIFTPDDLTVKNPKGGTVSVEGLTPADGLGVIQIKDRPDLTKDFYSFLLLILHEWFHRFAHFDDFEQGPDGYEETLGMRRFLNTLAASTIMALYDGGILAKHLKAPPITLTLPGQFNPVRIWTNRAVEITIGRPGTEAEITDLINKHSSRSQIANVLLSTWLHGERNLKRVLNDVVPGDPHPGALQHWRNLIRAMEGEERSEERLFLRFLQSGWYATLVEEPRAWVRKFHRDIRGVEAAPETINYHVSTLESGVHSRASLAKSIFEYKFNGRLALARRSYREILRRDPTSREMEVMRTRPASGVGSLLHAILTSDEFALLTLIGQ